MKDLGKILEYQELDIELRKIDIEFNKNSDKKKLDTVKNEFNGVQKEIAASVEEAERLAKEIEQVHADARASEKRIEELEKAFAAAADDKAKAALLPAMETEKSKLDSYKNKVTNKIDRIRKLLVTCTQQQHEKKNIKAEFDKVKAALEKQLAEIQPKRESIKKRMRELRDAADKELMEQYLKFRKDGAPPVFVKARASGSDYACYCGMQLSQSNIGKLKTDGMCRCDTCRRIVYTDNT